MIDLFSIGTRVGLGAACIGWVSLGCGVEQGASPPAPDVLEDAREASDIRGDRYASPFCEQLPDGPPLAPGRWASRQRSSAIVNLPPTNTPTTVVTTRLILHTVETSGALVTIRHETCSLRQPKLNGVEVVFGPAFLRAVPQNTVTVTVEGVDVSIPADVVVLGAEVVPGELLPTTHDDPRVRDSDDDGHPGVSVTLRGLLAGQLYVVYRQAIALDGTADPAGCVSGLLSGPTEQVQLGAFPSELEVIDLAPQPHPDPRLSPFQLVPLGTLADVATFDCQALFDNELELFGPIPD